MAKRTAEAGVLPEKLLESFKQLRLRHAAKLSPAATSGIASGFDRQNGLTLQLPGAAGTNPTHSGSSSGQHDDKADAPCAKRPHQATVTTLAHDSLGLDQPTPGSARSAVDPKAKRLAVRSMGELPGSTMAATAADTCMAAAKERAAGSSTGDQTLPGPAAVQQRPPPSQRAVAKRRAAPPRAGE